MTFLLTRQAPAVIIGRSEGTSRIECPSIQNPSARYLFGECWANRDIPEASWNLVPSLILEEAGLPRLDVLIVMVPSRPVKIHQSRDE